MDKENFSIQETLHSIRKFEQTLSIAVGNVVNRLITKPTAQIAVAVTAGAISETMLKHSGITGIPLLLGLTGFVVSWTTPVIDSEVNSVQQARRTIQLLLLSYAGGSFICTINSPLQLILNSARFLPFH